MYEEDLTLNYLQWLICHKTKPNQTRNTLTAFPTKGIRPLPTKGVSWV